MPENIIHDELLVRKESHAIKVFETDVHIRATFPAIYNYFQEAAYNHAAQVDLRLGKVLPDNNVWMLSRMEVEADAFPEAGARIDIETWSRGVDRLFFIRDFVIRGDDGTTLMRGVTAWVVVDAVTRRVSRPGEAAKRWPGHVDRKALDHTPDKLPGPATGVPSYSLRVRYSHLDRNHHVNNGTYIEWILDGYPMEMHDRSQVKRIEINFLAEALYGDTLNIVTQEVSGGVYLNSVVRESDGRELCRGRVEWSPYDAASKKGA